MVFAADENGDYTVPAFINVYVNGRLVGRTDIFAYTSDTNNADVNYPAVAEGNLTITRFFSPKRSKAVGYFDNLSYYESDD